jgi:transposase InsO family protein
MADEVAAALDRAYREERTALLATLTRQVGGDLGLAEDALHDAFEQAVSRWARDGVARSHSRPSTSNDNPYSEAQFKTLKYCPAFPARFGSIADARAFCTAFFDHYNHVHRHSGIGLHTPASVHYGTAYEIQTKRADTLTAAYTANPARFRHQPPTPPALPEAAWINQPNQEALIQSA